MPPGVRPNCSPSDAGAGGPSPGYRIDAALEIRHADIDMHLQVATWGMGMRADDRRQLHQPSTHFGCHDHVSDTPLTIKAAPKATGSREVLPGRALTVRPGLLIGPYDYTDRFTYWVARVARGGEVLAPGRPHRVVQLIDARDVATWIITMVEHQHTGLYNVTGWPHTLTMEALLTACRTVRGSDAHLTWVSEPFLHVEQVAHWTAMPLRIPEDTMPHMQGVMAINCQKAMAAGLRCRPLHETIRDTLRWYGAERQPEPLNAGITADHEQHLLHRWHATHGAHDDASELSVAPAK